MTIEANTELIMIQASTFQQQVQQSFKLNADGIVGVVDRLLIVSSECKLTFDWDNGDCRIRSANMDEVNIPMRVSLFRAMIARVAAIVSEQTTDSISPYQGDGTITLDDPPEAAITVTYRNNPGDLLLMIAPKADS